MADDVVKPGPPSARSVDLVTSLAIAAAVHLEQVTRGGPQRPAPYYELKQQQRPGPARDNKGKFRRRV